MMRKRSFYFLLIISVLLTSIVMQSCRSEKPKIYTVGVINIVPDLDQTLTGFKEGMKELGYIEGKNIRYLYNGATTDMSRLSAVAQSIVTAGVDLILTMTTPATLAVKDATAGTGLPVVFAVVTDPLGAGIVKSMQSPGGNITGVTFGIQEARRLEWLVKIAPETRNIYVPFNSRDKSPVLALKAMNASASKLGVRLLTREFHDLKTLDHAVLNIPAEANAVFLLPDSLMGTRLQDIVKIVNIRKLPTSVSNITALREHDILTSFGFDQFVSGKQAARLAHEIFKGTRPADLPVETAEFFLCINLKTAKKIDLVITDEILRQADVIIR